ncbi:hypothetical protein ACHAXS_013907 [Conticribra weissflogii]
MQTSRESSARNNSGGDAIEKMMIDKEMNNNGKLLLMLLFVMEWNTSFALLLEASSPKEEQKVEQYKIIYNERHQTE